MTNIPTILEIECPSQRILDSFACINAVQLCGMEKSQKFIDRCYVWYLLWLTLVIGIFMKEDFVNKTNCKVLTHKHTHTHNTTHTQHTIKQNIYFRNRIFSVWNLLSCLGWTCTNSDRLAIAGLDCSLVFSWHQGSWNCSLTLLLQTPIP